MAEIQPLHINGEHNHLKPFAHQILGLVSDYCFPADRNHLFSRNDLEGLGAFKVGDRAQLVGLSYARFLRNPKVGSPRGIIVALAVDSQFQRQGIGTQLLEQTEQLLRSEGLNVVTLATDEDNPQLDRVVRFYTKCGYEMNEAGVFVKHLT